MGAAALQDADSGSAVAILNAAALRREIGMMMTNPRLCYVKRPWAWFTTQDISQQWGDDWDDAPYEHNAGAPYQPSKQDVSEGRNWKILRVVWDGDLLQPCDEIPNSSPWSVAQINAKQVAWLRTPSYAKQHLSIMAGATLEEFLRLVQAAGGTVYMPVNRAPGWRRA